MLRPSAVATRDLDRAIRLPNTVRTGPESAREIGYLSGLKCLGGPEQRACAHPGRFLDRSAASG